MRAVQSFLFLPSLPAYSRRHSPLFPLLLLQRSMPLESLDWFPVLSPFSLLHPELQSLHFPPFYHLHLLWFLPSSIQLDHHLSHS